MLLTAALTAGCQNLTGPFRRDRNERIDDPYYTIGEQERRGRASIALPDETGLSGPPSGLARPMFESGRGTDTSR
jgi:hypothetical protein